MGLIVLGLGLWFLYRLYRVAVDQYEREQAHYNHPPKE